MILSLIMIMINVLLLNNLKVNKRNFTARLKQANLPSENNIGNFVKKTDFDNKLLNLTSNKNELNKTSRKGKQDQQKN